MADEIPNQTTFREYQQAYPEQARAIITYANYRVLANLDRGRFWDPEIYNRLKQELKTDNPIRHPGAILYDKQVEKESPQYRAASDTQLPSALIGRIRTNTKALELWQKAEPEEYQKARELIEAIKNGQLEQFDPQKLKEILCSSLYIFPGVTLALLIQKDQSTLQR